VVTARTNSMAAEAKTAEMNIRFMVRLVVI
jgi:hypothetical protein